MGEVKRTRWVKGVHADDGGAVRIRRDCFACSHVVLAACASRDPSLTQRLAPALRLPPAFHRAAQGKSFGRPFRMTASKEECLCPLIPPLSLPGFLAFSLSHPLSLCPAGRLLLFVLALVYRFPLRLPANPSLNFDSPAQLV